jgi:hypothetical protein
MPSSHNVLADDLVLICPSLILTLVRCPPVSRILLFIEKARGPGLDLQLVHALAMTILLSRFMCAGYEFTVSVSLKCGML